MAGGASISRAESKASQQSRSSKLERVVSPITLTLQGYLAHKKQPPPLGPP